MTDKENKEIRTVVTDGQDLAEKAADYKKTASLT